MSTFSYLVLTPGTDAHGRTLAYRFSALRSVRLSERWPLPIGVAKGPAEGRGRAERDLTLMKGHTLHWRGFMSIIYSSAPLQNATSSCTAATVDVADAAAASQAGGTHP